jgi:hypothetical protein
LIYRQVVFSPEEQMIDARLTAPGKLPKDRVKDLDFVQKAVARMADHSFLLKGWTATIAVALSALAIKDSNRWFAVLTLFPSLTFWGLDAYYLRQERLFQNLYDELRKLSDEEYENADLFSMRKSDHSRDVASWLRTLWAPTIVGVHGLVVVALLAVIAVLSR